MNPLTKLNQFKHSFTKFPPTGWLYDITYSYNPGFILAGSTIAISGAMLFAIPPLQRYLARKHQQATTTTTSQQQQSSSS